MRRENFRIHEIVGSVKFVQGYRYLDKCGEALIRLEDELGEGWLPMDATVKGGGIVNEALGLKCVFSSQAISIENEHPINFGSSD